jgi:iron-sulfur cluster repair protein YtfE (RIC family)
MATLTQPLRDEHRELLPHVEVLRTVADSAGDASMQALRAGVDEAYEFLAYHLIPHAQAEDSALYPVVDRVLGAPGATATMSRDHVEVGRLTQELASLRSQLSGATASAPTVQALRRVLYGLYALVKVHFAKEEEVYLPLLDARLSPVEAQHVFEAMEAAAKEAKQSGFKAR